MGDPKTVLEGSIKYRDRKKWKARWAVVSKLSPVADCLHLQLYRDSKERCKNGPTKASLSLEGFLGMETGFTLDKESNTMALICTELVVVLAFDSRELLIQWQVKIRGNLAEEQQFLVQIAHIPTKSKLPCGPARLHLQDYTFCLVAGVPPRLLGTWPLKELRRFGVVEGKFCFEGGSLCGKGEGLHVLLTNQSEDLVQAMDSASKGKLLGKRKPLTRKNSVLETSSRSAQKSTCHTSENSTTDSGRPLLSSGSECSTCDACSEILRAGCEESAYNSASTKASSCRIHYRWPSCMSRWGQSSTITTSDVESMDTVSVTLSDYQGPGHASASSKASSHGTSLLCLCDGQNTWPLNHCNKCGRQFYSRCSLGHTDGGRHFHVVSPAPEAEASSGFSPQWTMNAALPSPSREGNRPNSKKDFAYQLMLPSSDRASLCSHTSRSSSASTASSSGSEYSVPRNFLDSLYDKPRTLHAVRNGGPSIKKNGAHGNSQATILKGASTARRSGGVIRGFNPTENEVVCPCHEPINDWTQDLQKPSCSCWNQLSLPVRSEKELTVISCNQRSTNPSPSSSPKKVLTNSRNTAITTTSITQRLPCTCRDSPTHHNMHYAVPRTTLSNMLLKEKEATGAKPKESTNITENPHSEDYDVPKKFVDILTSSDIVLKSSLKALETSAPCSCKNIKMTISQTQIQQSTDTKIFHRYDAPIAESMQMCTCQRLVLWAGSFVPCLGGPASKAADPGWQGTKGIGYPNGNSRAVPNHYGTICCEPARTAELVLMNGKPKHILCEQPTREKKPVTGSCSKTQLGKGQEDGNCSEIPLKVDNKKPDGKVGQPLAMAEIPHQASSVDIKALSSEDGACANYANLEFAHTLSLYENSNCVLSRVEQSELNSSNLERPLLPPRSRAVPGSATTNSLNHAAEYSSKSSLQLQVRDKQKLSDSKRVSGSAYELMNFEKHVACTPYDDDYLMMQPVYYEKIDIEPECKGATGISKDIITQNAGLEDNVVLPLRPFMPFSYPHLENSEDDSANEESYKHSYNHPEGKCIIGDAMTRRHHLIQEHLELRSTRSNSLSELKKIVLLRKRSSSVDGKNNVASNEPGIKSNPASPICSPKPSAQRKTSLFSKLNLRSKEKSMSTNEIILPMTPAGQNQLGVYRRCSLHRSADCLKVNEEYANSDDDLSNDTSEVSAKETMSMKRSSSVPCRSAMPGNLPSPRKNNVQVIPELSDLSKESTDSTDSLPPAEDCLVHGEYNFGSTDKLDKTLDKCSKTNCDSTCKHVWVNGPHEVSEGQGAHKRNHHASAADIASVLDPYKNTSSSSSDMSDFIESLSHCSRSSSTSSGSSCDYIRCDDVHLKKCAKSSNLETVANNIGPHSLPKSSLTHVKSDDPQISNHLCVTHGSHSSHIMDFPRRVNANAAAGNSSSAVASSPRKHIADKPNIHRFPSSEVNSGIHMIKTSNPVMVPNASFGRTNAVMTNGKRARNSSRSPTSSTSSLSTSPSTTDYSSSSSGNYCGPITTSVTISEEGDPQDPEIPEKASMDCNLLRKKGPFRSAAIGHPGPNNCLYSKGSGTPQKETRSDV